MFLLYKKVSFGCGFVRKFYIIIIWTNNKLFCGYDMYFILQLITHVAGLVIAVQNHEAKP